MTTGLPDNIYEAGSAVMAAVSVWAAAKDDDGTLRRFLTADTDDAAEAVMVEFVHDLCIYLSVATPNLETGGPYRVLSRGVTSFEGHIEGLMEFDRIATDLEPEFAGINFDTDERGD